MHDSGLQQQEGGREGGESSQHSFKESSRCAASMHCQALLQPPSLYQALLGFNQLTFGTIRSMIILPTPTQISVMHVVEIGSGWSVATFCTLSTLNFGIDSHVCTIPVLEQSDTMSGKRDLEIFLGNNNDPFYT